MVRFNRQSERDRQTRELGDIAMLSGLSPREIAGMANDGRTEAGSALAKFLAQARNEYDELFADDVEDLRRPAANQLGRLLLGRGFRPPNIDEFKHGFDGMRPHYRLFVVEGALNSQLDMSTVALPNDVLTRNRLLQTLAVATRFTTDPHGVWCRAYDVEYTLWDASHEAAEVVYEGRQAFDLD